MAGQGQEEADLNIHGHTLPPCTAIYCIRIRTRRGPDIQSKITLCLKESPRAKPEGTPEGKGLYSTVYPELSHNADILSF